MPKALAEERVRFRDGQPEIEKMSLNLDEGLGFQAAMDGNVLHLLSQLNGGRTLREALAEGARRDGIADVEGYVRAGLPSARRMFELGFLERVVQSD